jgi:transcription antitermination factor NusG
MLMTQIGDVLPWHPGRQPLGPPLLEPEWYILKSPPQQEARARLLLENLGVPEVWMPTEKAFRTVRGKRGKVEFQKRIAPGYLFAQFDRDPVWDRLFAIARGRLSGVVGVDGVPRVITEAEMWAMEQAPERIEEERRRVLEQAELDRLARRPAPGTRATLLGGPMAGYVVDVTEIHRGLARWLCGAVKGETMVEQMRREG